MLVWAEDREQIGTYEHGGVTFRNHPLAYWLDTVRHQADPDSPVLIVQNKCDRPEQEVLPFPVAADALKALPHRKQLHVSARARRGEAALKEALHDAITWLRDPARLSLPQIGAGRLRVQRRLEALRDADMALPREQRRHRLLERSEFEAICGEEGGVTSPALLLAYLDANGTVFHRPGLFADRIVLDQGWALEAIYAVFDRKLVYRELRRARGRFTRSLLGLLVWQQHSDAERQLLLDMMRSCGICFRHRRFADPDGADAEHIAPDLLPEREEVAAELAGLWDDDRPCEEASFRYSLLHGGLIRTVMAAVREEAGPNALYWRGGLCGFEATTRSRLLIGEEMTGPWQGAIRIRTQGGHAAELLQRLTAVVEKAQAQLGMGPIAVERPSPVPEVHEEARLALRQEKPAEPEWYVSYAWGDDKTPEGRTREQVVDDLCAAAEARGHRILRDKEVLGLGDSISRFMRRIGAGDRVFVILSEKYLRSPHRMFELSEIWRTSRQEGQRFLDRIRVYALPDAKIWDDLDWTDHAIYWKDRHDALNSRAKQHGAAILGESGQRRLMQMQRFYTQVTDILATVADIVQPRSFDQLERYGFYEVAH